MDFGPPSGILSRVDPGTQKALIETDLHDRLKHAEEAPRARELNFQLIVDSIRTGRSHHTHW